MAKIKCGLLVPLLAGGLVAACAATPITVSSTSAAMMPSGAGDVIVKPQPVADNVPAYALAGDGFSCTLYLMDASDVRLNPDELGMVGGRVVHVADSIAWLKNALAALKKDPRLTAVDSDNSARITLRVELVKAYIMTLTTQKSSNVVLRAIYGHGGKDLGMDIARGSDVGVNWSNGADEAQGSLNRALASAVSVLDNDVVTRCKSLSADTKQEIQ